MNKIQAAILLAVITITAWPVISMAIFDDSCRDGFWKAYKAHLFGWLALVGMFLVIFSVVFGFIYSIEVLIK